jgi:hypothetical protein
MRSVMTTGVLGLAVMTCPALTAHGDEPKAKTPADPLMRQKLEHAQKALSGLALGDFDALAKSGRELIAVSQKTGWRAFKTPEYDLFTNEFRRRAGEMVEAAGKKNVDAAAIAYVEMTMTCVRCHKYVREQRMARLD